MLPSLHGGGAERVAVHILNHADPERFDVRMGLLRKSGPYVAEIDDARVLTARYGRRFLDFDGENSKNFNPVKLALGAALVPLNIRSIVARFRPDVVLSFMKGTNLATYAALRAMGRRRPAWIAREGNNALAVIDDEVSNRLGRAFMKRFVGRMYRASDCFLTISQGLGADLQRKLGVDPGKCRTIYNSIDTQTIRVRSLEEPRQAVDRPFIVTAGRLEYQKGHDALIRSFARSAESAGLDLLILGEGSRLAELQALARLCGVGDRVRFLSFDPNPWAYFARARLFVLPSRWEGFANVVPEAMAAGAPVLVTECDYGPREIVEHGVSGWVTPVDDEDRMVEALDLLLSDRALAGRLARAGGERAKAFDIGAVVASYAALFLEVSGRRAEAAAPATD